MDGCFSEDYIEARAKFIQAAQAAGATITRFALAERGPDGGELSTDVAWLGPPDASRALITISGTHGVEGFFGSATQVEWLRRVKTAPLKEGVAALHIHAINPYGFAWQRRTNEGNVDINRNWMDFGAPLPANLMYDELSDDLCPSDWSAETQARTGARLQAWIQRHDFAKFQKAVSSGQWTHPDGLFYGGTSASWSRRTLTEILTSQLRHATRVLHSRLSHRSWTVRLCGAYRGTAAGGSGIRARTVVDWGRRKINLWRVGLGRDPWR